MNKFILSTLLLFLFTISLLAQTQNRTWSLPPNYVDYTPGGPTSQSLPTQTGFDQLVIFENYKSTRLSSRSHNAMHDANGNLLFFIVDDLVYDADGFVMAPLPGRGNSEIVIIPVPGSCSRYYIVTNMAVSIGTSSNVAYYPVYVTLDLSVLAVDNYLTGRPGALIDISTGAIDPFHPGEGLSQNLTPVWPPGQNNIANVFMGATKLRGNNTRFLFISNGTSVYRYNVTDSGIFSDNSSFLLDNAIQGAFRSELEIVEIVGGGNTKYRIAVPYKSSGGFGTYSIKIADLDNAGNIISGTENIINLMYMFGAAGIPYIKGLEFSPNGRYLYFTHLPNSSIIGGLDYSIPINIYDNNISDFVTITNSTLLSEIYLFQFSTIELAEDGKLYLINNVAMATIGNADNPTSLSWNSTALPIGINPTGKILDDDPQPTPPENNRLHVLPDQIDGMDYTASFNTTACCIETSSYDVEAVKGNEEHFVNGIWSPGTTNNPFNSTTGIVTVRDKLVIKSGTTIGINNMTFKFSPNAQLIVENGATLNINGCILTVEDGCDPNALMWHGVEVWGTTGTYQTATTGGIRNSGIFKANNSTIEHAMVATANARHNINLATGKPIQNSFSNSFSGGIIKAANTTFRNNYKDTQFYDYYSIFNGNTYNDQSLFNECNFVTDAALNDPNLYPFAHALLRKVKGINFIGCVFENTATGQYIVPKRGFGIRAYESLFTVTDKCSVLVPFPNPCPAGNSVPSEFNNLFYGVFSLGATAPTQTAKITNSLFNDNFRGMYFANLDLAEITNNQIYVGNDHLTAKAYGLRMDYCDKYKVEDNIFTTTGGYFGAYINSSGTGANEIYRNSFSDFVVATQAANINGDRVAFNAKGLEFRCNDYTLTTDFDILVSSGRIRPYQGDCFTDLTPANNIFSYTTTKGDYWVNDAPATSMQSLYRYSPQNGNNLAPRNGFFNIQNTGEQECLNLNQFDYAASCPKHIKKTKSHLKLLISDEKQIIDNLASQVDDGDTQMLLNLVATTSGGNLKNTLMNASPLLSDEVLIAYILSNPTNGHLQQVLLANSPLSEDVLKFLDLIQLPKGILSQINNAQTGISPRQELEGEIVYHQTEIEKYSNDLMRIYLFDETKSDDGIKEVIAFLEEQNCKTKQCLLTCAYIANNDFTKAQLKIDTLITDTNNLDFCKLYNSVIQYEQTPDKEYTLLSNAALRLPVEDVAIATTKKQEVGAAQTILELINNQTFQETFEYVVPSGSNARLASPTVSNDKVVEIPDANIYPNPTKEQFYLTHNLSLDNGEITLSIFDLMGREMITKQINDAETIVNTQALKSGVYFYAVTQNGITIKSDKLMIK